jgi:hypothetical protein
LNELLDKLDFILLFLNFCLEDAKNYYNNRLLNLNIPKKVLIITDEYKKTQLYIENLLKNVFLK